MKATFLLAFLTFLSYAFALPVTDDSHECPICYQEMDGNVVPFSPGLPDTAVVQPFECGRHLFHFGCSAHCIRHGHPPTCPVCRANVLESILRPLNASSFIEACENGQVQEVQEFLSHDPIIDSDTVADAFFVATENGHSEVLRILLEYRNMDPSEFIDILLDLAYENGQTESAILLSKDSRTNPKNALRLASVHGKIEIVKMLLDDPRIYPEVDGDIAVSQACASGRTELVKFLLRDERLPDPSFSSCLITASVNGRAGIVNALLESDRVDLSEDKYMYGSDIGQHALTVASQNGHMDIVKVLLENGKVKPTVSALRLATEYGHSDVVRLLERFLIS